tara:strand:- start:123216 stop:124451 length:1236 start_codon:yes stop_codon:yes gene_type:complete
MIPSGWQKLAFGDIASRLTRKNTELNDNVLTISALDGLVSQEKYFNKRVAGKNLSNYFLLHRGDFAYNKSFSRGFPVGAIKRLDHEDKGVVSPIYLCFELAKEDLVDSDFLAHLCSSELLTPDIRLIAKQGARAHGALNIKPADFFGIRIKLPPLPEQKKIAEILGSVDEAIQKTQAVISQTERVKKGLLQELLTRGMPGRHTRFKKTEIGEIPADWEVVTIGDVAEVRNGSTPRKNNPTYWTNGTIPWLPTGKVNERIISMADQFITTIALDECPLRILPVGSVLMAMIGQGKTRGKVALLDIEATINQNFASIVPGESIDSAFLFHLLESSYQRLRSSGRGSNQDALNCKIVRDSLLALPVMGEQQEIASIADGIDRQVDQNRRFLDTLQRAKRGLTNDLLTGKVRVKV